MPEQQHDFQPPAPHQEPGSQRMTNDDFRKLMMTPRASSASLSSSTSTAGAATAGSASLTSASGTNSSAGSSGKFSGKKEKISSENAEKRKKKKSYYAKLKKQEDDKMAELAAKYRDRAAERRDGGGGTVSADGRHNEETNSTAATSGYRAVAPDVKSSYDAAERRRQMIQESKFLGGDMEHTHLVKGLDFALLQKVRSEIFNRENGAEDLETTIPAGTESTTTTSSSTATNAKTVKAEHPEEPTENQKESSGDPSSQLIQSCKTSMAKSLCRLIFKPELPEKNELFMAGRMAYVIDLDEEFTESDIPTTTIRSKADCQGGLTNQTTLSTNDIVINKLTQILSYLRAGTRNKKKKKDRLPKEDKIESKKVEDLPLYDDVGDYVPSSSRQDQRRDRHHDRKEERKSRHRDDSKKEGRWDDKKSKNYFPETTKQEQEHVNGLSTNDKQFINALIKKEKEKSRDTNKNLDMMSKKEPEGYAECYPGLIEMNDAIDDSDDEVDYSKMDLGNKKGPVGRWDFDTAEEYADYMGRKEALPKAAFQYGVKMAEGRKTRGKVGTKNEKAKLDKEWNKISAIIDKRKTGSESSQSSKKPRYDE